MPSYPLHSCVGLGCADSSRVLPKSTGEVSQWASLFSALVGS